MAVHEDLDAAAAMPQARPPASGALLFISDLHLSQAAPLTAAAFEQFLAGTARHASALFILGDLFEYWVGDDMLATPFAARIAAAMLTLREHGVAVYVMHGNRDFLLGQRFASASGATLLPDPTIITAFGQRVVLAHGDALCTADAGYQRYRRVSRMRVVQRLFALAPYAWRMRLAGGMRARSEAAGAARMAVADITPSAADNLFRAAGAELMIHGHTHRCARHALGMRVRYVLPDWELDHGERGGYLRLDAAGIHLHEFGPTTSR